MMAHQKNICRGALLLAWGAGFLVALSIDSAPALFADEVSDAIAAIRRVGPQGEGHREASIAWNTLAQADAERLPEILAGLNETGPLAANWLRPAFETIAQRELDAGGQLPLDALEAFLADQQNDPHARRLSFEWIVQLRPSRREPLLATMLNDPSLELRREAVATMLANAEEAAEAVQEDLAIERYRMALDAARDLDQVETAANGLSDLEEDVDLTTHFGFLMRWQLIAPFDNTDKQGFDRAFAPETSIDLEAHYDGKEGEVAWQPHTTTHTYGIVDLNEVMGNIKGATAYAYATFLADEPRDVELRLGCVNGNKVWLNGELLTEHHVYHTTIEIDQYVGQGRVVQGTNHILVKICQNEQSEGWAQRWQFQLRVCDETGTALLSADRNIAAQDPN